MSGTICPYCRGPVLAEEQTVVCSGCETVHHSDCYEENGGCTVFGCTCAPPEEPKLSVSTPELASAGVVVATAPSAVITAPAPPPMPGAPVLPAPVAAPEPRIEEIGSRVVPSMFSGFTELSDAPEPEEPSEPKSRITYMVLGALLGALGIHNFYAGYRSKALMQLAITALTVGLAGPMSWIWAVIDICTIDRDSKGVPFRS